MMLLFPEGREEFESPAVTAESTPLYDAIGGKYAHVRRPDPRIAAMIEAALGDARRVVNIGAGTGAYEPSDRQVVAVEPSDVMIRQRQASAAPCLQGSAEALPLETKSVDAAMAILSAHHWRDLEQGFREMARVARQRAVFLTWVPDAAPFWLTDDYFPEIAAQDRQIFPTEGELAAMLERLVGPVQISPVPLPHDCTDTYGAHWRHPEAYLDPEIRGAMSAFAHTDAEAGLARLRADLASGHWGERNHHLLAKDALDIGHRLVTCEIRNPES
jgi:SAM-dependent methyltransferase